MQCVLHSACLPTLFSNRGTFIPASFGFSGLEDLAVTAAAVRIAGNRRGGEGVEGRHVVIAELPIEEVDVFNQVGLLFEYNAAIVLPSLYGCSMVRSVSKHRTQAGVDTGRYFIVLR